MSGIEEKPIKEELSLRTFEAFGLTFEEYIDGRNPGRIRERRDKARKEIFVDLIYFAANFITLILSLVVGSWGIIFPILGCALFLYWLDGDIKTYVDNTQVDQLDIGRISLVRDRRKTG